MTQLQWFCAICTIAMFSAGCSKEPAAPPPTSASPAEAPPSKRVVGPLSEADAKALAAMNDRIKDYLTIHDKIEKSLPKLPKEASPQEIDSNQREFERRLRSERASAKQGDIFTADAEPVIRRLLAAVFAGPEGKQLKSSIMDENVVDPVQLKVRVNSRYPDSVPLTTVPPQVLQTLPELTEDLEYRFVGDWLVLLDSHAHLIADYLKDVLPN